MLDWTIERASRLTSPLRLVPVVAAHHRRWWESALRGIPAWNVVVQPANRGTAIGILFSLFGIIRRDANAIVVIMPTDHYFESEEILQTTLRQAITEVTVSPAYPILLGIMPSCPDTQLGYIVPGLSATPLASVRSFVEKPSESSARQLFGEGALWNSFVVVSRASALMNLFHLARPSVLEAFHVALGSGGWTADSIDRLFACLPDVDFSRDILEKLPSALRVMTVPKCGWTDLGTPVRVEAWRETVCAR